MPRQPFTRLIHPDPVTNRLVQDLYDKIASVSQPAVAPVAPVSVPVIQPKTTQGSVVSGLFTVPSLTAVPSNNPTTGFPYSQDGVVIQFSPVDTDSGVLFRYSLPDLSWRYMNGRLFRTQSQLTALATLLGSVHTGLLVDVTDYAHTLRWSGSAWTYDDPADFPTRIVGFDVNPGVGWHLCDGTASVAYLKADGATATVNLPDLVSAGANAAYLKLGSPASLTPNAATAPTFTGGSYTPAGTISAPTLTMNSYTPAGTVNHVSGTFTVVAGAQALVISISGFSGTPATLTGSVSAPTFTGTAGSITGSISTAGQPRNLLLRPYMRL